MSSRKDYAAGAIIVGLIEAAWFVASNYTLVRNWTTSLQNRGGMAATVSAFVTNPAFHLLVACSALYLAARAFKAVPDTASIVAAPAQLQSNPQTQHVHINLPNAAPQKPQQTAPTPIIQRNPNLVCLGARTTTIHVIQGQYNCFFSDKGPGEEVTATLVGFRNDTIVGHAARDAERSKTHVLYYDAAETEIASILGSCWLNESGDLVDFDVGKALWLIVAMFPSSRQAIVPWYKRRPSDDGFGDVVTLEDEELKGEELEFVEIRIISEWNNELIRAQFTCSTDQAGRPILAKREP